MEEISIKADGVKIKAWESVHSPIIGRIIENQKSRIIEHILDISRKIRAPDETIADLEAAKSETQFSKAVDRIKHALPDSLQIGGHNPLTLLRSALSEGLHAESDKGCLASAQAIRLVLVELAERITRALNDDRELNAAVGRLMNRQSSNKNG